MNIFNNVIEYIHSTISPTKTPVVTSTPSYCFVSSLPMEAICRIFYMVYREESPFFEVCKTWASLKTNKILYLELYNRIRPLIFNKDRVKNAWGDPLDEPRLPLYWLCDFNPREGAITLVPEKVIKPNHTIEYLRLETLEQWAENPIQGHPYKFFEDGWREVMGARRLVEATHWVWIHREALGKGKDYADLLAQCSRGKVAGLVDLTASIVAKYVTIGSPFFQCRPQSDDIGIGIRVADTLNNRHIAVGHMNYLGLAFVDCDLLPTSILVAKKSFGFDDNGKRIALSGSMHHELDLN